jgi:hypothetical protein
MVLFVLNAIFMLVFRNALVIILVSGPKYVNVIHLFLRVMLFLGGYFVMCLIKGGGGIHCFPVFGL